MPQFDYFSFFSQLFWVFLSFSFLYLSLVFYLLPAISVILKVRKRKIFALTGNELFSNELLKDSNQNFLDTVVIKFYELTLFKNVKNTHLFEKSFKINTIIFENKVINDFSQKMHNKVSDLIVF